MRAVCHSLGHDCLMLVLASAKSNTITNVFVKSILVQKFAYTLHMILQVSGLGLHCLSMTHKNDNRGIWVSVAEDYQGHLWPSNSTFIVPQ